MCPDRKIAAPEDVDQFWAHMLDSKSYVRDCDGYFGCYLYHPCIGVADMADDAQATLRLYREAFPGASSQALVRLMRPVPGLAGCGKHPLSFGAFRRPPVSPRGRSTGFL